MSLSKAWAIRSYASAREEARLRVGLRLLRWAMKVLPPEVGRLQEFTNGLLFALEYADRRRQNNY